MDIGLEQAGFSTVLANELEKHSCKTLEENRTLFKLGAEAFGEWFDKQLQQRCYRAITEREKSALRNRLEQAVGLECRFLEQAHIL